MAGAQGIRAGKAFVELYANDSKLTRGLRAAQRKLKRFSATVNQIGMSMVKFAAIAAIPIAISLKIGASFEAQMSKVKAVTAGTEEEFQKLNQTAKELGRTTVFTATQVSEGMVNLGRAGFSRKEIDQAIAGVLDLARATDTELAMAAEITGSSLRQFNLEASETGRVTDVLTATANGSAQTLEDLGEALKYAAPIAAEAGDSIEATSAAIGLMANNGIKGTMAGTALARAYKNLSADNTAERMESIGVAVADANGNMRPMADILREIGEATANMGSKERLAIFEELFGRGQAAALKLAKAGLKADDMLSKIQNSQGLASKTAKEMSNNFQGAFLEFQSAAEGVAIAIFDALKGPGTSILKFLTEILGKITTWIENNQSLVRGIVAVVAVIGGLGATLLAVGAAAGFISFAIGGLAAAGTALAAIFAFLASPLAGVIASITLGVAAITALTVWFIKSLDAIKRFGKVIVSVLGIFVTYLKSGIFATAGKLLWASLKVVWLHGITDLNKTWEKLKEAWKDVTDAFVSDWKTAISDVNKEMKNLDDGKAKPFDEGVIEVITLTPQQVKDEEQKRLDDKPIMPTFAEEEDPETAAAKERMAGLEAELAKLKVDDSKTRSIGGDIGSGSQLGKLVNTINAAGAGRTMEQLARDGNSLQAEAVRILDIMKRRMENGGDFAEAG